jgi:hypothetical protein
MTHEETMVRTAYAKLSFASEQVAVAQLAMEATGAATPQQLAGLSSEQRIANAQLNFTLSDFVVGNVNDILNKKATELINPAVNQRLYITEGYASYHRAGQEYQWFQAMPKWVAADPIPVELASMTLGEFLNSQWHQKQQWATYASYSVTVTFQGKSAGPYKALFLFGHDDKGNETVEPEDGTVDAIVLARGMQKHLFADALLLEDLFKVPVVKTWVSEKQQPLNCAEDQGVCCDLSSGHCGPSQSRVEKAQKGSVQ